jgi:hypothetical protein
MLEKSAVSGTEVRVTFRMPPLDGVVELYLCGEFNNWHMAGAPLTQEADGSWVATLVLQAGKSYRFRYLDNQGRWLNDWDADAYVPNDFGTEDSVVDLVAPLKKVPHAEPKGSGAAARKGTTGPKGTTARKGGGSGKRTGAGKGTGAGKPSPAGKKAAPRKRGPRPR